MRIVEVRAPVPAFIDSFSASVKRSRRAMSIP
jgi:hypothetical protein